MDDELWFQWFIGIFEGEGTIYVQYVPRAKVILKVEMKDEDVIRRVWKVTEAGTIYNPSKRSLWRWQVAAQKEVLTLLEKMYPFMGERRSKKIDEAFKVLKP